MGWKWKSMGWKSKSMGCKSRSMGWTGRGAAPTRPKISKRRAEPYARFNSLPNSAHAVAAAARSYECPVSSAATSR